MCLYLEGDLISAPRGSDLLKHRYTERDLEELLQASAIDGVKLVDFFPKGIPASDSGWGCLTCAQRSSGRSVGESVEAQDCSEHQARSEGRTSWLKFSGSAEVF